MHDPLQDRGTEPGTTTGDTDKLIRLDKLKGQIYPVKVGNRYSYDATFQQKIYGRKLRTTSESCEVTETFDAARLHGKLDGLAYLQVCEGNFQYQRSPSGGRFRTKSYFLEAYGIWIAAGDPEVDNKWTLKSFE